MANWARVVSGAHAKGLVGQAVACRFHFSEQHLRLFPSSISFFIYTTHTSDAKQCGFRKRVRISRSPCCKSNCKEHESHLVSLLLGWEQGVSHPSVVSSERVPDKPLRMKPGTVHRVHIHQARQIARASGKSVSGGLSSL